MPTAIATLINLHDSLVALLARHQLGDHGAILLVNSRLVCVGSANGVSFVVTVMLLFALSRNFRQLKVVSMSAIFVWSHLALHVVVGQHRVVKGYATLRCMALSLVFVVIDAIYVDNSLVILA